MTSPDTLATIKAREAEIRQSINDRSATEVDIGSFSLAQVGLRPCAVDSLGRVWDVGSRTVRVVFDPMDYDKIAKRNAWD